MRRKCIEEEQQRKIDNPQQFWKNLKSVVPDKKGATCDINLELGEAEIHKSEVANRLNSVFASMGQNLTDHPNTPWFTDSPNSPAFIDHCQTDFDEVRRLIREINTNKSSGIDKISANILKDPLLVLTEHLVYSFNLSLGTGIFPEPWKLATVVPLFKGGSSFDQGNYRPISLLPVPGKLLEKIIHASLSNHLETNNLLVKCQGGFSPNHSNTSSVAALTDDIFEAINCQKVTVAVFADLAKAFDTVNHRILLVKLIKLGVTGQLLAWCKGYLENRRQRTVANNITSGLMDVPCGVPQGSVLCPLFFLAYINDLVHSLKHVSV